MIRKIKKFTEFTNIAIVFIICQFVQSAASSAAGILEVISPPSSIKLDSLQHSIVPKDSGYRIGQSIIGRLHFLKTDLNVCDPLGEEFKDQIAAIERNPSDYEEHSAMIQNFVLVDQKGGGCKLREKLTNLYEAGVTLPIIVDKALWQISAQLTQSNQKRDLELQTEGFLAFFVTDGEAKQLKNFQEQNKESQIFLRATLENDEPNYRVGTKVDLVFSSVFDLMPDAYYQMGLALSELEEQILETKGKPGSARLDFKLVIQTRDCFSCSEKALARDCLSTGSNQKFCFYEPIMKQLISDAEG